MPRFQNFAPVQNKKWKLTSFLQGKSSNKHNIYIYIKFSICFRLLAHAGFDARDAVKFWENRSGAEAAECARHGTDQEQLARRIMGETHPVSELRINSLKKELERWEDVRQKFLAETAEIVGPRLTGTAW